MKFRWKIYRFRIGVCEIRDARYGKRVLNPVSCIPYPVSCVIALALFASVAVVHGKEIRVRTTHSTFGVSGFVRGDNTGYFDEPSINIKNAGAVNHFARKGYIRMDISGADFKVRSAYLDLIVSLTDIIYKDVPQIIKVYGLTDESLDNWDPAKTIWNNAPANEISTAGGVDPEKTLCLGEFSVVYEDAGTPKRFASSELIDFLNSDTNGKVTFILCRPDSMETFSGWNLLLAGDTHNLYAPPRLTLSSYITTLSGQCGVSGVVSADDAGAFGGIGGWHMKNDADQLTRFTRKGYIRFDLSGSDVKVAGSTLNLTLRLVDDRHHYYGKSQTLFVYGLTDESLDNWNPVTTIWSNAPGNDTNSAVRVDSAKTVPLGEIIVKPTDVEGSVKTLSGPALDNFLNSDTNGKVTFILSRKHNDGYKRDLKIVGEQDVGYSPPFLNLKDKSE